MNKIVRFLSLNLIDDESLENIKRSSGITIKGGLVNGLVDIFIVAATFYFFIISLTEKSPVPFLIILLYIAFVFTYNALFRLVNSVELDFFIKEVAFKKVLSTTIVKASNIDSWRIYGERDYRYPFWIYSYFECQFKDSKKLFSYRLYSTPIYSETQYIELFEKAIGLKPTQVVKKKPFYKKVLNLLYRDFLDQIR